MAEFIEVHTTIDTLDGAKKIAEGVVSKRLAACVQISGPIKSTYWWNGKMEEAEEWVCTAKTRKDLFNMLELAIKELHTYEVPEILATDTVEGSKDYFDWIEQETTENL